MASAVLEVEKRSLQLKSGTYLIRGSGASNNKSERSLHIENESVDEKHAMIIAEADGIFIYDLDTRSGTFINEQRLPTLSKFSISGDVSIRFGTVVGKLSQCSTLEQHHSSGFHDESLHLALDQTSEAENLTIPETQCVTPEQCIYAYEDKNNKNVSNDTSIPETQDVLELAAALIPSPKQTETVQSPTSNKGDVESQFCISSQDFNDGLNETADSNSRDFLDNLHWLIGDEQPTTIKQPVNPSKTAENNQQQPEMQNASHEVTQVESDRLQEDLLRSQTHTPDLFDATLLEEFEKKEARLNNAKANRTENDSRIAKETNVASTGDESSEERTQTATEKSFIDEAPIASDNITTETTTAPPSEAKNEDASDNKVTNSSDATSITMQVNRAERDLFENEKIENAGAECDNLSDQPLQHSNKENMIVGVATQKDLEPTQVFVSKKAMKAPAVKPPSKTTSINVQLVLSDFEPTQVFVPKKQKNESSLKYAGKKKAPPLDEKDLEPTQKFVPKKSLKRSDASTDSSKDELISLNSTLIHSERNERAKRSARSFFAEVDGSLQDEQQPSCSNTSKNLEPDKNIPFMLTPEIISNTFADQKPPGSESRRKLLLNRIDSDSESEDSLTRLLTKPRVTSDFDSLIDSIKKIEQSPDMQNSKDQNDIMQKYIDTKNNETPKKKPKLENKPVNLDNINDSPSSRSLPTKRNASEEPTRNNKRLKNIKASNSTASSVTSKASTKSDDIGRAIKIKKSDSESSSISRTSARLRLHSSNSSNSVNSMKESSKNVEQKQNQSPKKNATSRKTRLRTIDDQPDDTTKDSSGKSTKKTKSRKERKPSNDDQPDDTTKDSSGKSTKKTNPRKERKTSNDDQSDDTTKDTSGKSTKKTKSRTERNPSNDDQSDDTTKDTSGKSTKKTKSRTERKTSNDDQSDDTTKDTSGKSTKKTKSRKERKPSTEKNSVEAKNLELIIEEQGRRTRSRTVSTVTSSQIAKLKCDEKPTTSKAAKKDTITSESKTEKKPALKLSFTMVEPEKKEELLKHTKSKWEEAKDPMESEILVMDDGNRTLKFLIAVAKGIPIVTSKWLEAIRDTGVISVRSNYFFKDSAFERNFKFSLLHTLSEAKKAKLFTNFQFLLTSNIVPTSNDMKMIITCAGGTILEKENIPEERENQQLYLISSEKDRQHWHSYRRKNANLCITNTEAVMLAVMRYDYKILKKRSF